jgi:hypothetical protein
LVSFVNLLHNLSYFYIAFVQCSKDSGRQLREAKIQKYVMNYALEFTV